MPKLAEEILAQTNGGTLTPEERSYVRFVLGVGEDTTSDLYTRSETRFTTMATNSFFNKAIRTLIIKYGKLGDDVIELAGVKNFASETQRLRIGLMLQNFVFPNKHRQVPLEDVLTEAKERELGGVMIQSIPVNYGELGSNLRELDDEFDPFPL